MEQSKENKNLYRSNDFRNENSKGKKNKTYLTNMTQPNSKKNQMKIKNFKEHFCILQNLINGMIQIKKWLPL